MCYWPKMVFIGENVKIGNGVKIQNNVSIFNGVELEDDVFVGPSVVFTNVKFPSNLNQKKISYKLEYAEGSTLAANSTRVCGIKIGKTLFVGTGPVVTKNAFKIIL